MLKLLWLELIKNKIMARNETLKEIINIRNFFGKKE